MPVNFLSGFMSEVYHFSTNPFYMWRNFKRKKHQPKFKNLTLEIIPSILSVLNIEIAIKNAPPIESWWGILWRAVASSLQRDIDEMCEQKNRLSLFLGGHSTTGRMGWMAHRKWKEIKQQPSMLPGPAVPGCCLVSFHFLWAIHPIRPVYF